ncbi:MAG: hypothetical protein ACYTEX_27930 [Planctomycetota bacterium]|jgi:hypothetical protein
MRPYPALNPPRHHCGYFAQLYRWPDGSCIYLCPECHEPEDVDTDVLTPMSEAQARSHFIECNEKEVEQWTL